ncbi:MAG TPA: NAD(P)-binding domain-containing protein, partial [Candidatus Dormibacteraeota bacterium]|nr:NAD(P)-binding domain-containing protein [Candidatus Dormibacteraeota bacterium]
MGRPMVRRLLGAGYAVGAYDNRPDAVTGAREDGAEAGTSPADVASGADAVITMLPDARAVERIVYDGGLVHALRPGQILLEMTSSAPRTTRRIAADLVPKGVRVLDAPVSGG